MTQRTLTAALLLALPAALSAQDIMRLHRTYSGAVFTAPLRIEEVREMETADTTLLVTVETGEGEEAMPLTFGAGEADSITFATSLADEEKGHDKYRTFALYIDTEGGQEIADRDTWVRCHISLDGQGQYSDCSGMGLIRGRGNSTWEWYEKKPYKIKLDAKSKLLGLDKAKRWNLLANYRDPTDMMNTFAFEAARLMGMPHTNHSRYCELFLNGEYWGLYQLTEKIEVADNRVDIDRDEGVLLSLDLDDGPGLSPDAGDNFWSAVYGLPVCVKYPEDATPSRLEEIRADFAELEQAIREMDYERAESLMDMDSFISILQLHEYLYNVEIDAPRSLYLYRDKGGKYTFGPVWDWDAGYDFDWSDMYTGHTFFTSYKELIYGTDPYNNRGAAYTISRFFRNLFGNARFTARYKEAWEAVADSLYSEPWAECRAYHEWLNQGVYRRESARWPIDAHSAAAEQHTMSEWLKNRLSYVSTVVAGYPSGQ